MSQIFTDDDVNTLANGAPLTVDRVRFIESLLLAKLAGVEAGPFGYVLKGREWPNQVFYPADYMPADLNNWDEVYTLPQAAAKVVQEREWQPIETAPKDGTVIDLWVSGEFEGRYAGCFWGKPLHCCGEYGRHCDSEWHDLPVGWVTDFNEPLTELPTHWMPPPDAPAIRARAQEVK